jgi:hypothetical protein
MIHVSLPIFDRCNYECTWEFIDLMIESVYLVDDQLDGTSV